MVNRWFNQWLIDREMMVKSKPSFKHFFTINEPSICPSVSPPFPGQPQCVRALEWLSLARSGGHRRARQLRDTCHGHAAVVCGEPWGVLREGHPQVMGGLLLQMVGDDLGVALRLEKPPDGAG